MAELWTQSDIDTLKLAIKTGVQEVVYAGPPRREVKYHSLRAMRDLLASMISDVNGAPTHRLVKTKKGFRS